MTLAEHIERASRNTTEAYEEGYNDGYEADKTDVYNQGYAEGLKDLKQLRDQTRWIPVSGRLPKAFQYVLVTYEAFHWTNEPATYDVKIISFSGVVDFIAWMPLPEPYKEESEDI